MTTDTKIYTVGAVEVLHSSVNLYGKSGTITSIVTIGNQEADIRREDLELRRVFDELLRQWERDRPRGVDVQGMITAPIYRNIIDLGPSVIPLLLAELERKPDHWFWALQYLTRANPVPPESQGKLAEMTKAWLEWGSRQGYQW